jgi:hypothetical protein
MQAIGAHCNTRRAAQYAAIAKGAKELTFFVKDDDAFGRIIGNENFAFIGDIDADGFRKGTRTLGADDLEVLAGHIKHQNATFNGVGYINATFTCRNSIGFTHPSGGTKRTGSENLKFVSPGNFLDIKTTANCPFKKEARWLGGRWVSENGCFTTNFFSSAASEQKHRGQAKPNQFTAGCFYFT